MSMGLTVVQMGCKQVVGMANWEVWTVSLVSHEGSMTFTAVASQIWEPQFDREQETKRGFVRRALLFRFCAPASGIRRCDQRFTGRGQHRSRARGACDVGLAARIQTTKLSN